MTDRVCEFPACVDGPKPEWCGDCGDLPTREDASSNHVATLLRDPFTRLYGVECSCGWRYAGMFPMDEWDKHADAIPNRVPRDGDRVALEPCFQAIPKDRQKVAACVICGAPYTRLTELHWKANACTGCMLRTLRPFDYTHATPKREAKPWIPKSEDDCIDGAPCEHDPPCAQPLHATRNRVAEDYPEDARWRQIVETEIMCLQEAVEDLRLEPAAMTDATGTRAADRRWHVWERDAPGLPGMWQSMTTVGPEPPAGFGWRLKRVLP